MEELTEILQLKPEEEKLILLLRDVEWGEVIVTLKKGKPVMASTVKKDVKLDT